MVAEVIKLPTTATNNTQINKVGVVQKTAQELRVDNARAKELAEQATQNINAVHDAAKVLNEFAKEIQTNLSFSVDEGSGRSVITVIDSETGDVIRQLPAKEILAVANLIREFAASDIEKVGVLLAKQG